MTNLLKIIGRAGLILTILPPILFVFGALELPTMKGIMIVGTLIWLIVAPIVQKLNDASQVTQ